MSNIEEFNSLVRQYPCCSKLSQKGRECIEDLSRRGCIDRVLSFKDDGVYNGSVRFSSYSTGNYFPHHYYEDVVYQEIPNLIMPYGQIGNKFLHRNIGRITQYGDMTNECKSQMTLSLRRMNDFNIRDQYSTTYGFVLDLDKPIDLHYMIESVPLRIRTSQLVTLALKQNDVMDGNSTSRCDLRPERINELKRRYCVQCSLTESRCNGMERVNLTRVTPRFVATDLVSSDFLSCNQDKSILVKREIDYAVSLISKANELIKKNERLERQPDQISYINSQERIYDYINIIQLLKSLTVSNCKLQSKIKYKNLWIAEQSIRQWISLRLGVIP